MNKPPCDCGTPEASWHGDTRRGYCCDACWMIRQAAQAETPTEARRILGEVNTGTYELDIYLISIWRNIAKSCREQALRDWLRLVERSKTE